MKKLIISVTICLIVLTIFLIVNNNKKQKEETESKNISIILETEEGNMESNNFPSKEEYEYNKVVCENTNNAVTPTFNNDTWKLSLNVEEESIDGNFNCSVYFKEKTKTAVETIIEKATEGNSEGLITLNQPQTGQTEVLTEYRYTGSNDVVKNYINFNNETWRIIGVFPTDDGNGNIENRVKIIREESIGDYSWDTSSSSINEGYGVNQWSGSGSYNGADLMRLLNPGYESENINNSLYWNRGSGTCYNERNSATIACDFSSTGLTEEARNMIGNAKWYTSASDRYITASESYAEERASTTLQFTDGVTRTTNWTGKIGLMYPSDYGYASSECKNGEQTLYDYENETCSSTNWLYNSVNQWLLAIDSILSGSVVRLVNNYGSSGGSGGAFALGIRPVLFLTSSVKITGGTGTIDDMYELEI